jgi:hypothetical protein
LIVPLLSASNIDMSRYSESRPYGCQSPLRIAWLSSFTSITPDLSVSTAVFWLIRVAFNLDTLEVVPQGGICGLPRHSTILLLLLLLRRVALLLESLLLRRIALLGGIARLRRITTLGRRILARGTWTRRSVHALLRLAGILAGILSVVGVHLS